MSERWMRFDRSREGDVDAEIADELDYHLSMRAAALEAEGWDAAAARREAERRLGDLPAVASLCRREADRTHRKRRLGGVIMAGWRDVVHAVRALRRRPLFLAAACGTLALGIGATAAVYSMVDAVLLAPLPYGDPDRLVLVRSIDSDVKELSLAREAKETLERERASFSGIASYGGGSYIMSGTGEPEEITFIRAEHHTFELLRAQPALGTLFTPEHRADGGDGRVVVLSWKLWQRRFGGDPEVVGRSTDIREVPHRIIGVLPAGFEFPVGSGAEAWVPLIYDRIDDDLRYTPVAHAVARLAPGADVISATAEASAVVARVAAAGTGMFGEPMVRDNRAWSARVVPVREAMLVSDRSLALMLAAVALLLAIACANVANLFLVRASERRTEMAVRAALGGTARDLATPLVIEVAVVCALAAGAGLALAHWAVSILSVLDPGGLPRWDGIRLNGRAWAMASIATALAAFVCALAPSFAASHVRPEDAIRVDLRSTDSRRRLRLRDAVVGVEIGLVFVLLVGAALLLRSFAAVRNIDTGYSIDNVVTARVVLPTSRYERTGTAPEQFYNEVLNRLRALPGVYAASAISAAPMSDGGLEMTGALTSPVTGQTAADGKLLFAMPDYFTTLGVQLRGRDFTSRDRRGAPRVVILNESMASHLFPGEDAVGRRFQTGPGEVEVVGVVPDLLTHGPERAAAPTYYVPQAQFPHMPGMVIAVRTSGAASEFGRTLVQIIRGVDPQLPVADVRTLDENLSRVLARRRFDLALLGSTALAALALAAVGVFGVMAHAVSQRRREFGIRQAVGARATDVAALVLQNTVGIAVVGVLGGSLLAIVFARALRSVLFGIQPLDPFSFAVAAGMVTIVACVAALAPALRAARTDPADTLRN